MDEEADPQAGSPCRQASSVGQMAERQRDEEPEAGKHKNLQTHGFVFTPLSVTFSSSTVIVCCHNAARKEKASKARYLQIILYGNVVLYKPVKCLVFKYI